MGALLVGLGMREVWSWWGLLREEKMVWWWWWELDWMLRMNIRCVAESVALAHKSCLCHLCVKTGANQGHLLEDERECIRGVELWVFPTGGLVFCCETWFCVVIKLLHSNVGQVAS
jgi:hypothetical protein